MNLDGCDLKKLFKLVREIGGKRYNKLTSYDLEKYQEFDRWRYVNGINLDYGTTEHSKQWVRDNSDHRCPICEDFYPERGGRQIDHKLPRAQYPWLAMDFKNLWVICRFCNEEKGEMHWYEYEHYMLIHHPDLYPNVKAARPSHLLQSLKTN